MQRIAYINCPITLTPIQKPKKPPVLEHDKTTKNGWWNKYFPAAQKHVYKSINKNNFKNA